MNIILCGYKTCGKSTLGKAYSKLYKYDFIDIDNLIIDNYKTKYQQEKKIGEIHSQLGDELFRKLETDMVLNSKNIKNTVIATGGGTVLREINVSHLKSLGKIVYLKADKAVLSERILNLPFRPSFLDAEDMAGSLDAYLNKRDNIYSSIADIIIDTDNLDINDLVLELHKRTKGP